MSAVTRRRTRELSLTSYVLRGGVTLPPLTVAVMTVAPAGRALGEAQPAGQVGVGGEDAGGADVANVAVGTDDGVVVGVPDAPGEPSPLHAVSASSATTAPAVPVLLVRTGPPWVDRLIVNDGCDTFRATIVRVRRTLVLAAAILVLATPAAAHAPARIRVALPAEDARVSGDRVRVVLVGEGGDAAATFRLDIDGQLVDATGRVGGIFSSLSVRPADQLVLDVPVNLGEHTLTVTPNFDPDAEQEVVVRRFTVGPADGGGGAAALVLAGLVVAGAVGAVVVVQRKAAAQDTA